MLILPLRVFLLLALLLVPLLPLQLLPPVMLEFRRLNPNHLAVVLVVFQVRPVLPQAVEVQALPVVLLPVVVMPAEIETYFYKVSIPMI